MVAEYYNDKRSGSERRENPERRKNADPDLIYVGPERRMYLDSRTGKDRRHK
jgi:hypothetical protein